MADITQLITEYSSVTGRPVATLSVAEFLEFKKYAEKTAALSIPVDKPVEERVVKKEVLKKDPVIATHETKKVSEEASERAQKKEIEDKAKPKEAPKPVSNAFLMMRSIGG